MTAAGPWAEPQEVEDSLFVFPAHVDHLMPEMKDIPQEFLDWNHPWCQWQAQWFGQGLREFPQALPGIDRSAALRHLHCIQASYEPKHQHKEAAVAYLASLWLESPTP